MNIHKLLIFILSLVIFSADAPRTLEQWIAEDLPYLVEFYKERHQNPEISLHEEKTSQALASELRKVGFNVTENFGGYGIVGILQNGEGPTILYRTDMDALPMYEKTGLPYASQTTTMVNGSEVGTMHSCGHDIHMTTWLGTARAMAQYRDQWKGTLMLIGQPAEEIGRGARLMLDAGLYEKFGVPDYGIGLHSSPTIPAGQVGIADGYTMANAEMVDIDVFGVGSHGASPHSSVDPVVLSSMIIMELQTIVSRNVKPIDDAVITVGAVQGGTVGNIIPDEVKLKLTVRTFKEDVRKLIRKRIVEVCNGTAMAAGLPEEKWPVVHFPETFTPANYNDPQLTQRLSNIMARTVGEDNVVTSEPQLVAEDFARYGSTEHDVPTVLFWLGTVSEEKVANNDLPGLHSPFYYPEPETSIRTGVNVTSQILLELFNESM